MGTHMCPYKPILGPLGPMGPLINPTRIRIDRVWAHGTDVDPKGTENEFGPFWALVRALIGSVFGNYFSDSGFDKRDFHGF